MSQGLPAVLEEIADVAGVEAMWALVRARGGTVVFIPPRAQHRHWLTEIVGYEAAGKICKHFRSNHQSKVKIPIARAELLEARWAEVLARDDLSINDTALIMQVDVSTVSRRRARRTKPRKPAAQGQGELF